MVKIKWSKQQMVQMTNGKTTNGQNKSAADVICVRKYHDDGGGGGGGGGGGDHDIYHHPFFTAPIASGAPADLGDGMSAAVVCWSKIDQ